MRDSRHAYTYIFSDGRLLEGHHSNAVVIAEHIYHLFIYLFFFKQKKKYQSFHLIHAAKNCIIVFVTWLRRLACHSQLC